MPSPKKAGKKQAVNHEHFQVLAAFAIGYTTIGYLITILALYLSKLIFGPAAVAITLTPLTVIGLLVIFCLTGITTAVLLGFLFVYQETGVFRY
jgi:hypothetical protein